jgi:acyl-CoA synthetase (AMP-forming)/AMP-acid ligase II
MTHDSNKSLQAIFRARLEKDPEGNALTFFNPDGTYTWRTFREFHETGARYGSILSENGLSRGNVCVFMLPSDENSANALFGSLLIGALPLMVAPPVVRGLHSNLKDVLEHVVSTTSARVVVLEDDEKDLGKALQKSHPETCVLYISDLQQGGDPASAPLAFPESDDLAALQLTSGTTGFPRVCVWDQNAVLKTLDGMELAMNLGKDDVCVNWTPLYHDMGLINNFMLCMTKGIPLVMLETINFLKKPVLWLQALSATGATVTWSPNFGYTFTVQRVRDHHLKDIDLGRIKAFWNAAERIHLDTILAFQKKFEPFGVKLPAMKTNFGCAENVGGATFSDPEGNFVVEHVNKHRLFDEEIAVHETATNGAADTVAIVGVGRPYPGMSIQIQDSDCNPLPDGHVGEIALDTPSRMKGYLGNEEDTNYAIRGKYLHTGDYGYMRGKEVFWTGRVRERINLHGKKFDPSDFESVLVQIDGLRPGCFAAFGIDDEKIGTQRLVIVSEIRDSNDRPLGTVMDDVREQVATHIGIKVDEVLLLSQGTMTKTSSGKRRHRFYRELYLGGGLAALAEQN